MKAIPTRYAGAQFRSRLEAKWARFFDLVRWRWTYEPFDMDGYIPDFLLQFNECSTIVEVKPVVTAAEAEAVLLDPKLLQPRKDWLRNDHDFLVLGAAPLSAAIHSSGYVCWPSHSVNVTLGYTEQGMDGMEDQIDTESGGSEAVLCVCPDCHNHIYINDLMGWSCLHCRNGGEDVYQPVEADHYARLWREAGNEVQWKPPQRGQRR